MKLLPTCMITNSCCVGALIVHTHFLCMPTHYYLVPGVYPQRHAHNKMYQALPLLTTRENIWEYTTHVEGNNFTTQWEVTYHKICYHGGEGRIRFVRGLYKSWDNPLVLFHVLLKNVDLTTSSPAQLCTLYCKQWRVGGAWECVKFGVVGWCSFGPLGECTEEEETRDIPLV